MRAEVIAVFELVQRAAVWATGLPAVSQTQVDLWMAAPLIHIGVRAKDTALAVEFAGTEFNHGTAFFSFNHAVCPVQWCAGRSNAAQPAGVFWISAIDDVKKRGLDFFRDRAA